MNFRRGTPLNDRSPIEAAKKLWPDQNATGFDYSDFLHARGSPRHALFYSGLFWPEFVEFEGMVFLEQTIEDEADRQRVLETLQRHGGDQGKTEQAFNTIEVPPLFGRRADETTNSEDESLALRLSAMWSARLREAFPARAFTVEVLPADESTGEDTAVRFYQHSGRAER
jgi:hypothetical protein